MNREVIIVGGGIGGLAAAFALTRAGHDVQLLEQAPEFGEVGAGLQLAPNATRILAEWGLLEEVVAAGVQPRRLVLRDAVTGEELTHLDLGEEFRQRYGAPYVVVHRSDLHRILLEGCRRIGVAMETGRRVTGVVSTAHDAVTRCADGTVYRSAAVLGMDGLNSTLRDQIVGDQPIPSGYVAYRGTLPVGDLTVELDLEDVVAWIGPGCHLVQYALRRGEMVNQVAVFRSPAFLRGEAEWGGPDEVDDAFSHCCEHVRKSLVSLWRDKYWPMYDRAPATRWTDGRLGLLGDAAHPMLQYLAQGACQAIEDAHTVTALAEQGDWPTALIATQDARAVRTGQVQSAARVWGEIWHVDGIARLLRNELLIGRDPQDHRHIDWLYGF
ncbi:FAD-dependent oxidoreductase [Nonomuraea sp. B19D2]|uniref:FAD-dependent oxidoreductase n=1 Tax=Nonomuraea sp. B19D2 TaxID=3159561 RepID=UPI0032DACB14